MPGWLSDWPRSDILAAAAILLTAVPLVFGLLRWPLRAWLTERRLVAEFGADLYLPEEIANATRYYVRPDATSLDLAQEMEEGTNVVATREDLFKAVERFIDEESPYRHLLLLADAGMGKSSFVLNYYDYNRRKWWGSYKLAVIPLAHRGALEKVKEIERPRDTILFLDAFDEDPCARADYATRLDELMEACVEFRRVLITCRTQFFPRDAAIPKTAALVFAPRAGGAQHTFGRLYLAPFSDKQVNDFLRRRYWFWSFKKKRRARELVRKVPKLTVRPMLLAHIPDILQTGTPVKTSWDLYEILTDRWYAREKGFWEKEDDLKRFSEEVAVYFYLSFLSNGADRVPREVVTRIVEDLKVSIADIDEWKATSRSLLHRDADGNWKFAHRSIMEFLFLKRFFAGDPRCRGQAWTDQMKKFVTESPAPGVCPKFFRQGGLDGADLSGVELKGRFLVGAELTGADLSQAVLSSASLRLANLQGANLTGANLNHADLSLTILTEAKLKGAKLIKAQLREAQMAAADLNGANLGGADLTAAYLYRADLTNSILAATILDSAELVEANLVGANLTFVSAKHANFTRANFKGTTFDNANLEDARFLGADFRGADLRRVFGIRWSDFRTAFFNEDTAFPPAARAALFEHKGY